jgi:hypothetical protein
MSENDKTLTEIRARHERDERWHCGPSVIRLQSHEDRAFLLTEIERLRARVEALRDALSATHTWLGAALQCPAFQWDADQKQAAQHDYDDARAALKEAKP